MFSRLRIIVLGYIIRGPLGGLTWHHLQYVMGLAQLGHDVYFVEDSDDYPSCYDPERHLTDIDPTYGLEYAGRAFTKVGLSERWAYYDAHRSSWIGPCSERILNICKTADLLLNLSGVNPMRLWFMGIPARAFVDTDPVFTQLGHLKEPDKLKLALQHTAFFSFGENIGFGYCAVPDDQIPWKPTRQPVVLKAWPLTRGPRHGKFTTVMQWDSYSPCEYKGQCYEMKSASFEPYMDLPDKAGPVLELALGSPTAPRNCLRSKGWILRDSLDITHDPWTYQQYLQESKAEFSVAKHGYVSSGSGWFSERSAAYLASGRPVLLQDTGYTHWLEAGSGIIPFTTPDEALSGIEEINGRYEFHCQAARAIAEEYFDSDKVLNRLIKEALSPDN
jgi:hypothetical protein